MESASSPGLDSAQGSLDMLVSNAVVIDPVLGIVKGDIGIKEGLIAGVGKAGNPAVMDGVDPALLCAAATTVRDAEGLIATPGGIDVHVHFDSAQLCEHAIASGITTMLGGSLGPITVGIDCGGAWNVGKMLQAAEAWPINFGFLGRGNSGQSPTRWSIRSRAAAWVSRSTRTGARCRRRSIVASTSPTRWIFRSSSTPTR